MNKTMNIKRLTYIFALLAIMVIALPGQAQNAIRWRCTAKMITATEGELTVRAIVEPGWHLYGMKMPKGGPKPTVLDFGKSTGIKFTGDFFPSVKPTVKTDPVFGIKVSFWEKNVAFKRTFKLTGDRKNAVIQGSVTYMGCDDETCLPPKTENFKFGLK